MTDQNVPGPASAARPRILCISLSPIDRDARVLRQLSVLAEYGDVTTVGYGPKPQGATSHLQVPDELQTLPQTPGGVIKLALRRLRSSETAAPAVQWMIDALRDETRFDLIVANDARVLGGAFAVADGAPVWADMHEWAPEERTHVLAWRLLVAPLMDHLCRVYLPRAAAVTTVGAKISELYSQRYGVTPSVVRNAGRFVDLEPSAVTEGQVRLVHSGAAVPGRNIEGMIDVVRDLDERFSLDLFLVSSSDDDSYLRALKQRAGRDPRIRFRDPVPPAALPETLNSYDVGVFWMPPIHTNARLTLPNKLFDFVQARLAVAIGPTVEMEAVVRDHGLGVIAASFSAADCASSISTLTADQVTGFKAASHRAARSLSFEQDAAQIRTIVTGILGSTRGDDQTRTGSSA